MENPFGTASNKPQEESGFTELPLGVWFLARTSDRGGAVPSIKDTRDGVPFIFKTGLFCVGGDGKTITPKMYGSYAFYQAFLRPNYSEQGGPQSQEDYDSLSGRLTGFINHTLSPGIEGDARWANSMRQLVAYANELTESTDPDLRLTPDMFSVGDLRDNAAYMATVFALLLRNSPRLVIINQKVDKGKNGDRNDIVVGSCKDAIAANAKTREGKPIEPFANREGEVFDLYTTSEDDGEGAANF